MTGQQNHELTIAPANAGRVVLSGIVLFLLQYALAMFLGLIVYIPFMIFTMLPVIRLAGAGAPDAVVPIGSLFAIFPLMFVGGIIVQILATIFALSFVVGKHWGGARLAFVYD